MLLISPNGNHHSVNYGWILVNARALHSKNIRVSGASQPKFTNDTYKEKCSSTLAWYMDDSNDDQRLEHHRIPPKYISLDDLFRQTGVEYFKVNEKDPGNDALLNSLKKERNYSYEDEIICSEECLPNYHEKLKNFFTEHLHTDEEIRLVLEGSGYFDVRSPTEEWIRIYVTCGDLIIIPAGIYHRFTLDSKNYIKAKRYFIGEPVWTPYNRPADDMPCRKEYLAKMIKGF